MSETLISVDCEWDGPIPGDYSLSSISAMVIGEHPRNFLMELKPISSRFDPETAAVSGLDRNWLTVHGVEAAEAMLRWEAWIKQVSGDTKPVFCAYGLGKEWMFTDWYFQHFLGRNPFGHNGLDLNSYAMGAMGITSWHETSFKRLPGGLGIAKGAMSHNALDDAIAQGQAFDRVKRHREAGL